MTKVGEIRIGTAAEYDLGNGFVIEQFSYWNNGEPSWAIPAWEERGYSDFAEMFCTRDAAEKALELNGVIA